MVRRRRSTSARLQDAELIEEDEEVTAELWSFLARHRVASIDGDETWPELGWFGHLQENSGKEKN
jgi:hypothetical protein